MGKVEQRRRSDRQHQKRTLSELSQCVTKRRRRPLPKNVDKNMLSHLTDLYTSQPAEEGWMCPLESTDSEHSGDEDHLQNPTYPTVPNEWNMEEGEMEMESNLWKLSANCVQQLGKRQLEMQAKKEKAVLSDDTNESKLDGDEEQTQIPPNVPNEWDTEQEDVEMESDLWKLRANRVRQLTSSRFRKSRNSKCVIEFNVGFTSKRNHSADYLTKKGLFKVAKFALAMTSSQQEFIMEILENNFDLGLKSKYHKHTFACEVMNRVRQLKNCDAAVKYSRDIFKLPGLTSLNNIKHQSKDITSKLNTIPRTTEGFVTLTHSPDPCAEIVCGLHAETKLESHVETISHERVDLYPFCKEIGLKLHVNCRQPNEKLDVNTLTNGAMTEVTEFAEKLCGTFEQICVDILQHSFDLDLPSVDCDLARIILAQIPAINEEMNLTKYAGSNKSVGDNIVRRDHSVLVNLHHNNSPNVEACSAGSTKAIRDQCDIQPQNDLNSVLWRLRANRIKNILSVPHGEHCPLYSYSRCKKLGIDFNVGSGVKQNLDLQLLTNGIIVELCTFAAALHSAREDFITEILEYNFDLNLNTDLHRRAFAQELRRRLYHAKLQKLKSHQKSVIFELPGSRCVLECFVDCPNCLQDRNKHHQDDSGPILLHHHHHHPHAMTNIVSAEEECTARNPVKDPTSSAPTSEETLVSRYHHCKKIGLSLCVNKDLPRKKRDTSELTNAVMSDLCSFAIVLCGVKSKIINDIIAHNFNLENLNLKPYNQFYTSNSYHIDFIWFNQVVVLKEQHSVPSSLTKTKGRCDMQISDKKEMVKKRELEIAKKEKAMLSDDTSESELHGVGDEEQTQIPPNVPNEWDPEQEDVEMESDLWKLRANCVQQLRKRQLEMQEEKEMAMLSDDTSESELDGDEEQTQIPLNMPNEWDPEQEDVEMESDLWKLRANRVRQLTSSRFRKSRNPKCVIEFNVGFTSKRNHSADYLTKQELFKVAKFALAMTSSQQEFIMEILENNFDLGLKSKYRKHTFACEVMNRVRQLKNCDAAVKYSRDIFKLPGLTSLNNIKYQSKDNITSKLNTIPRTTEGFVALTHSPDPCAEIVCVPHAETKLESHVETISHERMDLYPFCKEIGLKLHVNCRQPNEKLDFNTLTNGAMTEVTEFAEKLCGTFEQICVDILQHNFDLDLPSVDCDLARIILAQIPAINEEMNLTKYAGSNKSVGDNIVRRDHSVLVNLHHNNSPNVEACSAGSTKAIGDQCDIQPQNDLNSVLWRLRANQIKNILSVPHGEHCPLYSYSRCKKLGIDFNVGSGVKQNLDPQLLTNGIMVELCTFAAALHSAREDFITEILEYNFDLNLNTDLHRRAFAQELGRRLNHAKLQKLKSHQKSVIFELPGSRCVLECFVDCPNCLQDRNKHHQDDSGPILLHHHHHPHAMTNIVSAEEECTARNPVKDPTSSAPTSEETLVSRYHHCKKIGLSLCVNKDLPRKKRDTSELTNAVMSDLCSFAIVLCGVKSKIINDIIAHNFNLENLNLKPYYQFYHSCSHRIDFNWFNQVFVLKEQHSVASRLTKTKGLCAMQISDKKEMQAKKEKAMLSDDTSESKLDGDEEQTQIPPNVPNEWDTEQEDVEMESDLWKLRANRVQQLTSAKIRKTRNSKCVIEFNVGFTSKRNHSADYLTKQELFKVAKFALAMTSSQQEFIMEILENNFDLGLKSKYHKHTFACEVMNRVRQLKNCDAAVKYSRDIFKLPGLTSLNNIKYQSKDNITSKLNTIPRTTEGFVTLTHSPDPCAEIVCVPHAETKLESHVETISHERMDLYPFCKEIGLKPHVNCRQPNEKLDVNTLTNGAMTEVTEFAEKLCGTFEQICVDILQHSFDLDLPSVDCDLARIILAQIPAINEEMNLTKYAGSNKSVGDNIVRRDHSVLVNLHHNNSPNVEACSAGSTKAIRDQCDIQPQNDLNSVLWRLRANRIKNILSVPHGEHCPLYSYSRCKKLGIDFNVGSGVKQNLDPQLLTNGIMVEFCTFAAALCSAREDLITEILDYNFDLNLNTDLHRRAFAQELRRRLDHACLQKFRSLQNGVIFELPGSRCVLECFVDCPNCLQDRNKRHQDDSGPILLHHHHHPHAMTNIVSAEEECTARNPVKDPTSSAPTSEETLVSRYHHCKKIGLSLCVNKDLPRKKLDTSVLTNAVMSDLCSFAIVLCGVKSKIINDIIAHNFNLENPNLKPYYQFYTSNSHRIGFNWFNQVFVLKKQHSVPSRLTKTKGLCAMQISDKKEMQEKKEKAMLSDDTSESKLHGDGDEEQTQIPPNVPNEWDTEQEDVEMESDLWKLRANRVRQLTSARFRKFIHLKTIIEFNVGFTSKRNHSADYLTKQGLFKVAKFALAMTSSQQEFIMEILENNFDLGLKSKYRKHTFACEVMNRVRQLKNCDAAVKYSRDIFELPGLTSSINIKHQSKDNITSKLNTIPRMRECFVALTRCPDPCAEIVCVPHAETKLESHVETISHERVDLYPFCKEIGLKPHVNCRQPNEKLDVNTLTNGAMTEVTEFAEKLCGTFEQICVDILQHNFDLDLPSVDCDLARIILAQIPAINEEMNLTKYAGSNKSVGDNIVRRDHSVLVNLHHNNSPNVEACSAGSTKAIRDQCESSTTDIQPQNDRNSVLWRLRANRIKNILSVPHGEHCPLYSYSRCKKLGIDFNVESGVKQNLDPQLLTNGIMVELCTFAAALHSAREDFITEILEYNFDLNLNADLHRRAFAQELRRRLNHAMLQKSKYLKKSGIFELPGFRCVLKCFVDCRNCLQDRNKRLQNDSESGPILHHRPHAMTDVVSEDECTAWNPVKDPTSSAPTSEETLVSRYHHCKQIGLSLCVNKDLPRKKLDTSVLTNAVMSDLCSFASVLCGVKSKIINDIIAHNFNLENPNLKPYNQFYTSNSYHIDFNWFNQVFVLKEQHSVPSSLTKTKGLCDMQISDKKEIVRKRQLEMQAKKEKAMLSDDTSAPLKKPKKSEDRCSYPFCREIGLDLDVTGEKSADKEKLDLELLTKSVVWEIHRFATRSGSTSHLSGILYDILDYNFDLSSQHHRRWEFSIATEAKVKALIKKFRLFKTPGDEVFKLPFLSYPPRKCTKTVQNENSSKSSFKDEHTKSNKDVCVQQMGCQTEVSGFSFADEVKIENQVFAPEEQRRVNPCLTKTKGLCDMQISDKKELFRKRQLEMQAKKEKAMLSDNTSAPLKKPKKNEDTFSYPFCREIGLDLDVTGEKSADKEKLDLELLTKSVVCEIHRFATRSGSKNYLSAILYDILDYNFDLSSQHHRRWEFSIATEAKVKTLIKNLRHSKTPGDTVFKLPFLSYPPRKYTKTQQNKKSSKSSLEEAHTKFNEEDMYVQQVRCQTDVSGVVFADEVKIENETWFSDEDTKFQTDSGAIIQMNDAPTNAGWDSLLQEYQPIKEEKFDPHFINVIPELDAEEECAHVKMESSPEDHNCVPDEPTGAHKNTLITSCLIPDSGHLQYYILVAPQVSEGYAMLPVCPNTENIIPAVSDTEGFMSVVTLEQSGTAECSMIAISQDTNSTLIKEEEETGPNESYHY